MKKLIITTILTLSIIGCKHKDGDDSKGWIKIDTQDKYSYYITETSPTATKLFLIFPGYGGHYALDVGNYLKKSLTKRGENAIIVSPYVDYKNPGLNEFVITHIKDIIDTIDHDSLIFLGVSAGACYSLELSNSISADKILPIAAGAYKKIGGQPTDELPDPSCGDVWFLNGFDYSTYEKYGILWDGTVYVDPTKRCADRNGLKISLVPGYDHGKSVDLINDIPDVIQWLME